MSYNNSPRPEPNTTNEDFDNTKSSFFITQNFTQNPSNSHRQTPTKQYNTSKFKTMHE